MGFLRRLGKTNSAIQYRKFLAACKDPEEAQARVWSEIIREISGAPFWEGKLKPGCSLKDFPITEYEGYRSAIDRSFQTGISELSGKPVIYWSESSGTSGKRKVFPITKKYREQFQRTTPPFLAGLFREFPGFLNEKVLYFAGMQPSERSPSGVEVGFISNFNYRNIPPLLQKAYAFPSEVFRDWSTFETWAPAYALASDLSGIIAITPSVLVQFVERIQANRKFYIDCMNGRIPSPQGIRPLKVSKKRLELLNSVLNEEFSFKKVWPTLEFICCWKSSGCALQLPQLRKFSGDLPLVDATYSATEGWVNVPFPKGTGGAVHPSAHVFEFLKYGDEAHQKNLIPLWELKAGESYEIFMTTAMGMIRYRLYDLVKCTGHFERSPIIEFVQKSLNEIILGMIRVSEDQILSAVARAGFAPSAKWFFAPNPEGNRLTLYTNSSAAIDPKSLAQVEEGIVQANKYYARDITRGWLKPIEVKELPADHDVWRAPSHAQSKPQVVRRASP